MRPIADGNSDIRFSCRNELYAGPFTVDLAFYDIQWYEEITSGTDADCCFEEDNGNEQTLPPPARKNIITGATLPLGDQWNYGYLEGEDSCPGTDDFTVDFDDRGMDSNQSDGTDWGEDDDARKCGVSNISGGTWFVWVRELDVYSTPTPTSTPTETPVIGTPTPTPTSGPIPTTGPMGLSVLIIILSGILGISAFRRKK
jgi:hypothetical protein